MAAVAASATALSAIVGQENARTALVKNNTALQAVRETMYNTVKNVWTKVRSVMLRTEPSGVRYVDNNAALKAAPAASLVFACLGTHSTSYPYGVTQLEHPDGTLAAEGRGRTNANASIVVVDGVSFGGAQAKQTVAYAGGFAEAWVPTA